MPYIAIEGHDFGGKSTLANAIKTQIKLQYGVDVVIVNEPSKHNDRCIEIYNEICTNKELTNEQRIELLIEQRRMVLQDLVLPALAEGKTVITDRCFISSMVYQTPPNGVGMQPVLERNIVDLHDLGDIIPDYGILVATTHQTFVTRCQARDGYMDELEKPLLVKENFDRLVDKYLQAMVYTKTLLPKFAWDSYQGDIDITLSTLASKFGWKKLEAEQAPVSGLTPPVPA